MKILALITILPACSGPGFSLDDSLDGGTPYDSTTSPTSFQRGDVPNNGGKAPNTGGGNNMGSEMDGGLGGSGGLPQSNGAAPASGGSPNIDTAFVRPIADKIVPGTGPDWVQDLSEPCNGEPLTDGDRYVLETRADPSAYWFEDSPTWLLCSSISGCYAECLSACTVAKVPLATVEHLKTGLVLWGEDLDGVKLFSISLKPFNLNCPAHFTSPSGKTLSLQFRKHQ